MGFADEVETAPDPTEQGDRQRRKDSWCVDRGPRFGVTETLDGTSRAAFAVPPFARAFNAHSSGVAVSIDVDRAMSAYSDIEDAYHRLAREYID